MRRFEQRMAVEVILVDSFRSKRPPAAGATAKLEG